MPNIVIKVPEGVFDVQAKARLSMAATTIAQIVEQGGDDPAQMALTWVTIEEAAAGALTAGGHDPVKRFIPAVVVFHYPAGVLDDAARAQAVRLMHEALNAAKPAADPRPVMTSVIMAEVADGAWGGNGQILRLPDFAKAAGYKHLQHLVVADPS